MLEGKPPLENEKPRHKAQELKAAILSEEEIGHLLHTMSVSTRLRLLDPMLEEAANQITEVKRCEKDVKQLEEAMVELQENSDTAADPTFETPDCFQINEAEMQVQNLEGTDQREGEADKHTMETKLMKNIEGAAGQKEGEMLNNEAGIESSGAVVNASTMSTLGSQISDLLVEAEIEEDSDGYWYDHHAQLMGSLLETKQGAEQSDAATDRALHNRAATLEEAAELIPFAKSLIQKTNEPMLGAPPAESASKKKKKKENVQSKNCADEDSQRRSARLASRPKTVLTIEQQATALLIKKVWLLGLQCGA
uniref:Uncharacterized protein n=1 Tax=Arundo donax TaxID=35708 RepID=A0A0A8Y2J4_ARUDO